MEWKRKLCVIINIPKPGKSWCPFMLAYNRQSILDSNELFSKSSGAEDKKEKEDYRFILREHKGMCQCNRTRDSSQITISNAWNCEEHWMEMSSVFFFITSSMRSLNQSGLFNHVLTWGLLLLLLKHTHTHTHRFYCFM